jgi:hypothetical protein
LFGPVVIVALVGLLAACSSSAKKASTAAATTSSAAAAAGTSRNTSASSTAASGAPGAFAKSEFTTPLAGVCPNPIVLQVDWLPEADHGFAYELIGGGGTMSQYTYEGPLGSTGVNLEILSGGPGLGSGVSQPSSLYVGNLVKRVTPTLAFVSLDDAVQYSKTYPVTQVLAEYTKSPLVIIFDPAHYSIRTLADLKAAAAKGAKIYVTSTTFSFVRWMEGQGIPSSAFIGGYSGDLEKFVGGDGQILNQGYATNEIYTLEQATTNWDKPVGSASVSDMGFPFYQSAVSVATNRLQSLAPCLSKLVPLMQRALVDYVRNPAEVNQLLATYNDKGLGAAFWKTPVPLSNFAAQTMVKDGLVANTAGTSTVGGFDLGRVGQIVTTLVPINKALGITSQNPNITAADVATNQFIDQTIGL